MEETVLLLLLNFGGCWRSSGGLSWMAAAGREAMAVAQEASEPTRCQRRTTHILWASSSSSLWLSQERAGKAIALLGPVLRSCSVRKTASSQWHTPESCPNSHPWPLLYLRKNNPGPERNRRGAKAQVFYHLLVWVIHPLPLGHRFPTTEGRRSEWSGSKMSPWRRG